jgi:hypothetical protein
MRATFEFSYPLVIRIGIREPYGVGILFFYLSTEKKRASHRDAVFQWREGEVERKCTQTIVTKLQNHITSAWYNWQPAGCFRPESTCNEAREIIC